MKRVCATFTIASLLLILGCRDYDFRLAKTIEEMKYQKELEKELGGAPGGGLLQQELIFVRPPKGLAGPTKAFTLTVVEPGKFDLENSFIDESNHTSLHVLARHKKPKAPPKKGKKASAQPAARGDFSTATIELLKTAYGIEDLTLSKFKPTSKRHGSRATEYREAELRVKEKDILVYLYGDKSNPYNVALIFEYPKSKRFMKPRINLCLETFAVGEAASRAFAGGGGADVEDDAVASAAPPS